MRSLIAFIISFSPNVSAFVIPCDDIDASMYFDEPSYTQSDFSTTDISIVDVSIPLKAKAKNRSGFSIAILFLDKENKSINEVYFDPVVKEELLKFTISGTHPKTAKAVFGVKMYTDACSVDFRGEYQFNKIKNENASVAGTDAQKAARPF